MIPQKTICLHNITADACPVIMRENSLSSIHLHLVRQRQKAAAGLVALRLGLVVGPESHADY